MLKLQAYNFNKQLISLGTSDAISATKEVRKSCLHLADLSEVGPKIVNL